MASVIINLKVMPESPDIDLKSLVSAVTEEISGFGGKVVKQEMIPVAFGLKSLNLHFVMKEDIGSTEELEKKITLIEGVKSVDIVDVRRAVG